MEISTWVITPPPSSDTDVPRQRTRKEHKKSRNGCGTCKKRHVRCDEGQPICSNCLTRGNECTYREPKSALMPSERRHKAKSGAVVLASTPLQYNSLDPFGSLDIDMPYDSYRLLQHYTWYRNQLRDRMSFYCDLKESPDFAPAHKRGLILMAAKHEFGLTGRKVWCDGRAYLHHKSQVLRMIVHEFAEAPDCPADWSILAICILVALESLTRDVTASETHLRGLHTLLQTHGPRNEKLYQVGNMWLKAGYIFLALIEASARCPTEPLLLPVAWRQMHDPFPPMQHWTWESVAYILSHFILEFLSAGPSTSANIACLQWFSAAVKSVRATPAHGKRLDPREREWLLAGACYALLLIAFLQPMASSRSAFESQRPKTAPQRALQRLSDWWESSLQVWLSSQSLPTWPAALSVLDKIAFLISPAGEAVVVELQHWMYSTQQALATVR